MNFGLMIMIFYSKSNALFNEIWPKIVIALAIGTSWLFTCMKSYFTKNNKSFSWFKWLNSRNIYIGRNELYFPSLSYIYLEIWYFK